MTEEKKMQVDYTSQQAKLETLKQLKHTNESLKAHVSRVSDDAFYSTDLFTIVC